MKPRESYWQASMVGRTVTTLLAAADTSTTAKVLGCLGRGWLQLGRGSLAASLSQVDWGASSWLAGSKMARGLARLATGLEQVGWAGARRGQTVWTASRVGQGFRCCRMNQQRAARFWAGLMLGVAMGTVAWGRFAGTLTNRRLLAAAVLSSISILLFVLPVNLPAWINNSRLLELARYLLNLGVGEQS